MLSWNSPLHVFIPRVVVMRLLVASLVLRVTAVYLKSNIVCVKQTEQRPFSVIEKVFFTFSPAFGYYATRQNVWLWLTKLSLCCCSKRHFVCYIVDEHTWLRICSSVTGTNSEEDYCCSVDTPCVCRPLRIGVSDRLWWLYCIRRLPTLSGWFVCVTVWACLSSLLMSVACHVWRTKCWLLGRFRCADER